MCAQRRLGSPWASAQSDKSLRCPHKESLGPWQPIERTVKTLIRLGGLCWFCHEAAHIVVVKNTGEYIVVMKREI